MKKVLLPLPVSNSGPFTTVAGSEGLVCSKGFYGCHNTESPELLIDDIVQLLAMINVCPTLIG